MTETDYQSVSAPEEGETVSQKLVRAREARGLSQKEVADEMFLTTTFIRYIDDGDFDKIPKAAFIKGYLRSYARVVGIEGDDIVAAFENEQNIAPQTPRIVDVTESADPPSGFAGPVIQTGVIGLVGVVLVGAVVWWIATDEPSSPVVTSTPEPAVIDEPAPFEPEGETVEAAPADEAESMAPIAADVVEEPDGVAAQAGEGEDDAAGSAGDALQDGSAGPDEGAAMEPREGSLAAENSPAFTAADVQIERVTEGGVSYITVYAGGEARMGFEFSDRCWVEITDANGIRVYGDLNREGDVMTVFGNAPFDVRLGAAPAVSMTVDGEPIDLDRFMRSDRTARVRTARL